MKDLLEYLNDLREESEIYWKTHRRIDKPDISVFKSVEDILLLDYNLEYHLFTDPDLKFEIYTEPNSTLLIESDIYKKEDLVMMISINVGIERMFSYSISNFIDDPKLGEGMVDNIDQIIKMFNDIKFMIL